MKINKAICIVAPKPSDLGGISRWCDIYTSFLKAHDIEFCLLDTTPTISIQSRKNIIKRVFSSIPLANRIVAQIKRLIKQKKISCVHIATSASLSLFRDKRIINICKKKNIPVIYHYHFGTFQTIIEKDNWEAKLLIKNSKNSTKTICIDEASYKIAKDRITNAELIHNPVVVPCGVADISVIKKAKKILFAGHVRDNKGINELIAAWDVLYKKNKDWELIIAGDLFFNFIEEAKKPENIDKRLSFTGHMDFDNLQRQMDLCTIFVLPSYFEGCPNVILEAMSHSMAVVATSVGAIPELINNCGLLIEPKNAEDIIKAVQFLIDNPKICDEYGKKAKNKIANEFSADYVCEQYLKLIEEVL